MECFPTIFAMVIFLRSTSASSHVWNVSGRAPLFARGCAHDPVCPIPVLGAMVVDEIGRLLGESFVRPLDPWTQPLGEEALWRREGDLVHATHP